MLQFIKHNSLVSCIYLAFVFGTNAKQQIKLHNNFKNYSGVFSPRFWENVDCCLTLGATIKYQTIDVERILDGFKQTEKMIADIHKMLADGTVITKLKDAQFELSSYRYPFCLRSVRRIDKPKRLSMQRVFHQLKAIMH